MSSVATDPIKRPEQFRDYQAESRECVKEFYRLNHCNQTLAFVQAKKAEYLPLRHRDMSVWAAMELLAHIVDDSDPDIDLPQMDHAFQTAERLRAAGEPRWLVLTGLIHDLGKVLRVFGEPQWAVVGDTFPVGCRFAEAIVYHPFFDANPDTGVHAYQSRDGIYAPGCGLDAVHLSWGHDEYLYHVVKDYLPDAAAYVMRYHSFYAWHHAGAYTWLMNARDHDMLKWVQRFNPHDLYSKSAERPDPDSLYPFYRELAAEFLPPLLQW